MKKFFELSMFGLALFAISFFACKHDGNNNTPSSDDPKLVLQQMKIHGVKVEGLKVTVPHDKATVKTEDVQATFNIADVKVDVKGSPVSLEEGKETLITITVPAVKGKYKAIDDIKVNVTRQKSTYQPQEATLELVSLAIHGKTVDTNTWKIDVPNDKESIKTLDVEARFKWGTELNKKLDVVVENGESLNEGTEKDVTLKVVAVQGKYKEWKQVIKVTRKALTNPIMIKGWYVDNKLVLDPTKDYIINNDSCIVKITVLKEYQQVEIDGQIVTYVAGSNPGDLGSYSKEILGIAKGSTKSVVVKITDANHKNSPFSETLKIKYEDASSYVPVEITRIDVGDEMKQPATSVEGLTFNLTEGMPLSLSVFFKENVTAGKEKLKFIVGDGSGDKTVLVPVIGKRVDQQFSTITTGNYPVKIERLVQNEVKNTFNFNVKYQAKLEKIIVGSLKIESEEDATGVIFKKSGGYGNKSLSELERADDNNLYEYVFSLGQKISVTVDVVTEDTTLQYNVGSGGWTSMSNNTKRDIPIVDGINTVQIKITKSGFKDTLYRFKAIKKSIRIKSISVGAKTYTWTEFEALTSPIEIAEDKITIVATWENDEVITPRLTKKGKTITVVNENKTATWKDIVLEAGENSFRVTFEIVGSGIKWKKKDFIVKKTGTPDSNVDVSDMKIFGFRRESLSPTRIEWPFARIGMTEFDIYIKPESKEVKGIKLKSPFEVSLSKTTEAGYEEYYKTSQTITSGDKIIFEVEAKDGSKKEYFVNRKEKWQESTATISFESYIRRDYVYYSEEQDISNKSPKKLFDKDSFLAEVPVSQNKIYLMFELFNYTGVQEPTFPEGVTLVDVKRSERFDSYIISYDPSGMQVGEGKDIEIHLKFKSPTNQIIDLSQYAKYTIKLKRN